MATQGFDKPSQFREELDKAFRKNKKAPRWRGAENY